MAFVRQYPHYLFLVQPAQETQQNEDGDFPESTSEMTFLSMCREETDGRGTEIQVGGIMHKITSLIQLPKTCPVVELGAKVAVANDAEGTDVRITGVCLRFDPSQLHSRLWL